MARNSNVLVNAQFAQQGVVSEKVFSGRDEAVSGDTSFTDALAQLPEVERTAVLAALKRARELIVADAASRGPGVMGAPDHRAASLILQALAERAADGQGTTVETSGVKEAKFDNEDLLGWAAGVPAQALIGLFNKAHWVAPSPQPDVLPDKARIAVLGDWGSGLYGAPVMAATIGADPRPYDLLLHLGDVYYAGTERAIRDRFLAFWPQRPEAKSRALNSNHEMYTGGKPFFEVTLAEFGQPSSCFAMKNDHWLLVGLDTAFEDGDLAHGQAEWLVDLVERHPGHKVVLFSHHQGASLYDKPAKKALTKLETLLENGKIYAWYWGHEHRCVLFDRHPAWGIWGRCIGHSGFPEFRLGDYHATGTLQTAVEDQVWLEVPARNDAPAGWVLDGPNEFVPDSPERYVPNGWLEIELDGDTLVETVRDPRGRALARGRHAPDGTVVREVVK